MKTALCCLGLIGLAVLFGWHQRERLAELEERLAVAGSGDPSRSGGGRPREDRSFAEAKIRVRAGPPDAREVFDRAIERLVISSALTNRAGDVMTQREAFRKIVRLDLDGQRRFIELVAASDDPRLSTDQIRRAMVDLCLYAMADRHPAEALDHVRHCDERIGEFYRKADFGPREMRGYCLGRLLEADPRSGLEAMVALEAKHEGTLRDTRLTPILARLSKEQPELMLGTAERLPEEARPFFWVLVAENTEGMAARDRIFRLVRDEARTTVLPYLCRSIARERKWRGLADWLEARELSDAEKRAAARSFPGMASQQEKAEFVSWVADYLPPSNGRDYIIWNATAFWRATDPAAAKAFFERHGIDPERARRLQASGDHRQSLSRQSFPVLPE